MIGRSQRQTIAAAFALLLGLSLISSDVQASIMGLARYGVGPVGGYNLPVGQADAEPGTTFGMRGRYSITPHLIMEPALELLRNGSASTVTGGSIPAPSINSFGLNALITPGGRSKSVYFTLGLGLASLDVPGALGSSRELTYNVGVGLEVGVGPIALDLSPRFLVVRTADGASRKHLTVVLGANYYFR